MPDGIGSVTEEDGFARRPSWVGAVQPRDDDTRRVVRLPCRQIQGRVGRGHRPGQTAGKGEFGMIALAVDAIPAASKDATAAAMRWVS